MRFIEVDDYYREVFLSFPFDMDATERLFIYHTQIDAFSGRRNGQRFNESDLQFRFGFKRTYLLFKFKSLTLPNYSFISRKGERTKRHSTDHSVNEISQLITQSLMGIIYHWGLNNSEQSLESLSIPLTKTIIDGLKN